ncbi:MAG TPA: hypothetical protein VFF04_04230 [Candidatus Babeliales bacterium]|nr:hypothetical protein [Candidatus Babeliales bacterium]
MKIKLMVLPILMHVAIIICGQDANSNTTEKVVFLFAHGIADSGQQAYNKYAKTAPTQDGRYIVNPRYIIDEPIITFDFPDAQSWLAKKIKVDFTRTSLAQENEIHALLMAYKETRTKHPDAKIVLVGLSRGASTILNFVALHNPENIIALVLESPFDAFSTAVEDRVKSRLARFCIRKAMDKKLFFWKHDTNRLNPIDLVHKIRIDMPILFICSEQEMTVPMASSERLTQKLIETGHTDIYLLKLKYGKHAHLLAGLDGNIYQRTAHAFYREYNIPHDPQLANEGHPILAKCQK